MNLKQILFTARTLGCLALPASIQTAGAAVVTNEPVPITHRVIINQVRTGNTAGEFATALGTEAQAADIIDKVNQIWAQAGVEVVWEPLEDYVNDFAYDNNGRTGYRDEQDLYRILDLPDSSAGVSDTDIDLFFVKALPGFGELPTASAAGLADIDGSGMTIYIGDILLRFRTGRDVVAGVIAHEIGHNLGLEHLHTGEQNLMTPGRTTDQIVDPQVDVVFTDEELRLDGFELLSSLDTLQSNYSLFAEDFDLQGGQQDDDDNDGLANLLEYALGTDPVSTHDFLPEPVILSPDVIEWTIPKQPEAVLDGLGYFPEVSANGGQFGFAGSFATESELVVNDAAQMTVRVTGAETAMFRLRLEGGTENGGGAPQLLTTELSDELDVSDIAPVRIEIVPHSQGLDGQHDHHHSVSDR